MSLYRILRSLDEILILYYTVEITDMCTLELYEKLAPVTGLAFITALFIFLLVAIILVAESANDDASFLFVFQKLYDNFN